MAVYDFKCTTCDTIDENVILPITHRNEDIPKCCGKKMDYYITSAPMVSWKDPIIQPFRPVATPNAPVISSMREHREYMKRNDLVDANETFTPPSQKEQMEEVADMQSSINQITPDAQQKEQLQRMGLDSVVD